MHISGIMDIFMEPDFILRSILTFFFGYCLYFSLQLSKRLYGGRLTGTLPPFVGAIALLFSIQIISAFFENTSFFNGDIFIVSMQMLQIGSGLLFITALYDLYQTGFATSGLLGGT